MIDGNQILKVDEARAILKISRKTLYNLIKSGDIHAVKVGREWRIMLSSIEKYMNTSADDRSTNN